MGIDHEYIQKQTPGDNGDIESFHNHIKTEHIWLNEFRDFHEAFIEIGKAFTDYNAYSQYSSIEYLPPMDVRKMFLKDQAFRMKYQKKEVKVTLDENRGKVS